MQGKINLTGRLLLAQMFLFAGDAATVADGKVSA